MSQPASGNNLFKRRQRADASWCVPASAAAAVKSIAYSPDSLFRHIPGWRIMFYGKKVLESNCFANQSAISICNAIVQQQEKESVAEQPAPQYAIFRSSARPLNEEEGRRRHGGCSETILQETVFGSGFGEINSPCSPLFCGAVNPIVNMRLSSQVGVDLKNRELFGGMKK